MTPEPLEEAAARSRALRDLWDRTLAQVATTFGRLAYLASLRDANSGRYQHFGLAQVYSAEEAERALRASHDEVFHQWLTYPLARQKSDLEDYLSSLEEKRETVLQAWLALSPYQNLVPADASEAQKTLFVSDLEVILELLRCEAFPSAPTPDA